MKEELVVDFEVKSTITCFEWSEKCDHVYCIAGTLNGQLCLSILYKNSSLT